MQGPSTGARPSSAPASIRRRRDIIVAARGLLREREADEVVVADVARSAGVSVATVYNLVGPRDRLLLAVLDEAVADVDLAVGLRGESDPIEAVIDVVTTAIDVVLSDPVVHRRVLASLGQLSTEMWLDEGLEGMLGARLAACRDAGLLRPGLRLDPIVRSVQLGFRGALISWVLGRLTSEEVRAEAELMACHVLANVTSPEVAKSLGCRIGLLYGRSTLGAAPTEDRPGGHRTS